MNKKNVNKKIGAIGLACLLAMGSTCAMTACKPDPSKNMSVLKIKIFNGGLGTTWINTVANRFMETFKEVSFEEGKKGIYVSITPSKGFTNIETGMASGSEKDDIFYTSTHDLNPFLKENVAYDLTDVMTANVYDANGNVALDETGKAWQTNADNSSLASRINVDYYKEAFNLGTEEEPRYCSVPYEDTLSGIIVDWDLFKDRGWNDYEGLDGMPATIDDFYNLISRIQRAGFSCFTYSTGVGYYTRSIQRAIQAKVDGVDWYHDTYSDYEGEYDFNGDGQITDDEKFTAHDSYRLLDTAGVEAAVDFGVEFFYKDSSGKTYYDPNVTQGVSYGGAQQDFIMSKTSTNRPRIAMILEGEWWENEARGTFNSMGNVNASNGYGKREFRMMPIPQMTENDKTTKYTIGSQSNGAVTVVNKKTVDGNALKEKLVELWLQYQYSADSLKIFTKNSGSVLPFDYEMNADDLKQLTPFARNVWDLHHNENVEIVYDNAMMKSDQIRLGEITFNYSAKIGTTLYDSTVFFNNLVDMAKASKSTTVVDYIAGMHTHYDDKIKNAYPAA